MPQSEDRLISDGGHVDYAYVKIPDKEPSESTTGRKHTPGLKQLSESSGVETPRRSKEKTHSSIETIHTEACPSIRTRSQ